MGYEVQGTTRTPEKLSLLSAKGLKAFLLKHPEIPSPELLQADVIVLNIPPFAEELDWFKDWPWKQDSWIIFLSSTSVYQDGNFEVNEFSALEDNHLVQQEKWISHHFQHHTILRLGGLLGGSRHPGKFLSGRTNLKSPLHAVNLIHQEDVVSFIRTVIKKKLKEEIINVVSDQHASRKDYYQGYAEAFNLPLPQFDESDKSLGKVVSNEIMKKHYQLIHPKVSYTSP